MSYENNITMPRLHRNAYTIFRKILLGTILKHVRRYDSVHLKNTRHDSSFKHYPNDDSLRIRS